MVGMRDVAKKAGVSLSSVSLVINGTGYVSQDMRDKVEQAMRELNYVPNELARNFYHGKTGIVGVIVPTHPASVLRDAHRASAARVRRPLTAHHAVLDRRFRERRGAVRRDAASAQPRRARRRRAHHA